MSEPTLLGAGFTWPELKVGQRFRTFRRTITESDIVNFIGATGLLEVIFIDTTYQHGAMKGRPVPGALTYSIIEGFMMQSMVQGTGLALLEVHKKMLSPVFAGDTVWAVVEITDIRPTSKGNRAIVTSKVDVKNQDGVDVMTYTVVRMLAGERHG